MKDLPLLVWLTQLGLSVAGPLVCYILLALWLQRRFSLGTWILWLGVLLGVLSAVDGLRSSLKALDRLTKNRKNDTPPAVSFNDHD